MSDDKCKKILDDHTELYDLTEDYMLEVLNSATNIDGKMCIVLDESKMDDEKVLKKCAAIRKLNFEGFIESCFKHNDGVQGSSKFKYSLRDDALALRVKELEEFKNLYPNYCFNHGRVTGYGRGVYPLQTNKTM